MMMIIIIIMTENWRVSSHWLKASLLACHRSVGGLPPLSRFSAIFFNVFLIIKIYQGGRRSSSAGGLTNGRTQQRRSLLMILIITIFVFVKDYHQFVEGAKSFLPIHSDWLRSWCQDSKGRPQKNFLVNQCLKGEGRGKGCSFNTHLKLWNNFHSLLSYWLYIHLQS